MANFNEIIIKNKNEINNEKNNNHKIWLSKMTKLTECETTTEFQKYKIFSLLEEAKKFEYNVIISTNDNIIIKHYYESNPDERYKLLHLCTFKRRFFIMLIVVYVFVFLNVFYSAFR